MSESRWEAEIAENSRLSGCLLAIAVAPEDVPASVLREIAHEALADRLTPEEAEFEIRRRAALALSPRTAAE